MQQLLNVNIAAKTFSVIGKKHVVTVHAPVLLKGERKMPENIIDYKIALAIFRNFLKMRLMTTDEYVQAEQMLAEKYGLSSCSIFRENA